MPKYRKIPREFKTAWVKALRSGAYHKGRFTLVQQDPEDPSQDLFCALGVAADLVACMTGDYHWEAVSGTRTITFKSSETDSFTDPYALLEHEFRVSQPAQRAIMSMNDSRGLSLAQIGAWIDENL
jgi:hypothetical protein